MIIDNDNNNFDESKIKRLIACIVMELDLTGLCLYLCTGIRDSSQVL